MRVISQDGTDDVPYEISNVYINERDEIFRILCSIYGDISTIAVYSNMEQLQGMGGQ